MFGRWSGALRLLLKGDAEYDHHQGQLLALHSTLLAAAMLLGVMIHAAD
jgi:hypothetical protein